MKAKNVETKNASINILNRALNSVNSNFDSFAVKATEGHSGSQACGDNVRPSARKAVAEEAGTILWHRDDQS